MYLVHAAHLEPELLSAWNPAPAPRPIPIQISIDKEELRRQVERTGIAEAELAGTAVVLGAPHRVITETASRIGADLVVVGATDSGPMAATLLGSTADRVVRKAACPVLLVRGELPVPPRRVLAAVDLSDLSGDAFRCGLGLLGQICGEAPAEVRATYALSLLEALALGRRQGARKYPLGDAERAVAEELRRFVLERSADLPFDVETAIRGGDARTQILQELAEHPADLVVLGTHGRGGLDRLAIGSVASTIARHAPCSVLLISPDAALGEGIAQAIETQTALAWHDDPVPVA